MMYDKLDRYAKMEKNAKEFTVSITHNVNSGTSFSYIPKPILEYLNNPNSLKFNIKNGRIIVMAGDSG